MDITFEIIDPDPEHHPNHFVVVAVCESGERIEVIGFKVRRDAVIIVDKLRQIFRNCKKRPKKSGRQPTGQPKECEGRALAAPGSNHTA